MKPGTSDANANHIADAGRKWGEIFAFAVLAVLIWPVIAIGLVGGYGFLIWMWQIAFGPPGPTS